MPRSMTGFGRADNKSGRFEITVEIRTLNNRYLDISLRLPKSLNSYEYLLKELTKKKILRGKITAVVNFKSLALDNVDFRLNNETVNFYLQLLKLKIKPVSRTRLHLTTYFNSKN